MKRIVFLVLLSACLSIGTVAQAEYDSSNDTVTYVPDVDVPTSPVPEPGTLTLMGLGMGALAYVNRNRKRRMNDK